MAGIEDLIKQLPLDKISGMLGIDSADAGKAAAAAVPALVQGMQANAKDPAGAASLAKALTQHADKPLGVDPSALDTDDGEKIVSHVFGGNKDQVINQLGGIGGNPDLIKKLLPMLAPLVMAFIAKQMGNKKSAPASAGGNTAGLPTGGSSGGPLGGLKDILGKLFKKKSAPAQVANSAKPAAPAADGAGLDDLLGGLLGGGGGIADVLGGLLGGGRR